MNNAEQIREFYRDNPEVSRAEAAQQLGIKDTTVRAMVSKDVKAGRAIYTELIESEKSIPDEYFKEKTEIKLDKRELLADMKEGLVIDGVSLQRTESLVIR